MNKVIPTLTIKPKKPRKIKKSNNIKLEFLNKPEPVVKAKTKGIGPDKQLRKIREVVRSNSVDEINNRKNNDKQQILNDLKADDKYYDKLLLNNKPKPDNIERDANLKNIHAQVGISPPGGLQNKKEFEKEYNKIKHVIEKEIPPKKIQIKKKKNIMILYNGNCY